MLSIFGRKRLIGLDIGSSSIKIAELDVGRSGGRLLNFGIIPTPANALNGGDIIDASALSFAIQSLAQEIKVNKKPAAVGMFGTAVIVKKITIPRIDLKMVADQVRWESEQYIPFDPASIVLEHHVINPKSSSENMDILLIAAQQELVKSYMNVVTGAGLKMSVLDVSAFALANLFQLNYGTLKGQTLAVINVGSALTNLVVISSGEVIFSRDMPIGGQNYTNDIHRELGISIQEAESLKLSAAAGATVPEEVHQSIQTTSESLSEEIRNSFDFFAGSSEGAAISQVFYTGGGAATPGLIKQLSTVTNLKFDWMNPFLRITPGNKKFTTQYLEKISPFCSVAMGLAMRKAGDS